MRVVVIDAPRIRLPLSGKSQPKFKTNFFSKPPEAAPEQVVEALKTVSDARDYLAGTGQYHINAAIDLVSKRNQLIPEDTDILKRLVQGAYQVYHVVEREGAYSFLIYRRGKWEFIPSERCIPIGD